MKKILGVLLLIALISGCSKKTDEQTCSYDACAVKAPDAEIQAVKDYLASKGITNAIQHCSGLFYVISNAGFGKAATSCSYVGVNYSGSLTNGSNFGGGYFETWLTDVVRGWTNVVPLIKEGGRLTVYIPPSLGYGNQANGPIPANSILIFDISLLAVR